MPEDALRDIERAVERLSHRVDLANLEIRSDIETIQSDVERLRKASGTFVSTERYSPVEKIVYGGVGLVLTAIVLALLALLIGGQ